VLQMIGTILCIKSLKISGTGDYIKNMVRNIYKQKEERMSLKARNNESLTNSRAKYQSTLQSNPRNPQDTILGDMVEIMKLVEQNKQLKRGKYVRK